MRRVIKLHSRQDTGTLSAREKRTIDKAIKRTVKEYKKTLDLLAKT